MKKSIFYSKTALAVLLGAVGLAICGGREGVARGDEPTLEPYHVVVEDTEPKKEDSGLSEKPKVPKLGESFEVLDYDLIGGPITFHGRAYVDKADNQNTFTIGEVGKGPPPIGGLFKGFYFLSKAKPDAFFFDDPLNPRKALQVRIGLGKNSGVVVYRTGYKRLILPGWVWSNWSTPLVAW
jgi:hypothetical protein